MYHRTCYTRFWRTIKIHVKDIDVFYELGKCKTIYDLWNVLMRLLGLHFVENFAGQYGTGEYQP
jgi:hypothetical protein